MFKNLTEREEIIIMAMIVIFLWLFTRVTL
jgi:hypothetical protein